MKRLIVIVEGDSELEFINKTLRPYLSSKGIFDVNCFKIKHSKGGLNKYSHLKKDIINIIHERNVVITTLIDFYGIPKDFPMFKESLNLIEKNNRVAFLEQAIINDINNSQGKKFKNFIPYIQLHEFEALIFSSYKAMESLYDSSEANFKELESIVNEYPNPEDINDNIDTAPSKRLLKNINGYNKVIDGNLLIQEAGIENILQKCLRFKSWVDFLIQKLRE